VINTAVISNTAVAEFLQHLKRKRCAHAQRGGDQIHFLALYTRLSLLLRTLFSSWLHCRKARSTMKLTKMIDFEVADSNMACGRGLCYRPGGQKATSRGVFLCLYTIVIYSNSQEGERPG
jgi:hypothetical protein